MGDIGILAVKEFRGGLRNSQLGPEAAKDLRGFKADVAAAWGNKTIGHDVQIHDVGIGQTGNSLELWHRRYFRLGTHVDKDPRGLSVMPEVFFIQRMTLESMVPTTASLPASTPAASTVNRPVKMPNHSPSRGSQAAWTDATSVQVGIQPVLTQVPTI